MKKKKYEQDRGLKGKSINYSEYHMSRKETVTCIFIGMTGGTIAGAVFFGVNISLIIAGILGITAGLKTGKKYFKNKRDKKLVVQFRDFLESLSASLTAGQNISGALNSATNDICMQYGADSVMAYELKQIISGINNGRNAEEMFSDLASRSFQGDIQSFAETFRICNRTGGNMRNAILENYRTLSEKLRIQTELETIALKGKNELRLMSCIPFVVVPMLKTLGDSDISGNSGLNIAVKIIAAGMIATAYLVGNRMTDIKI